MLDRVRQAGFVLKRGATMIWGVDRKPWSWYFSETNASNPHSYQVWRPEFDAILLDNARNSGVEVREGCPATAVEFDDAETAIAVRCGEETLPARYVVDASGQGGLLVATVGPAAVGRFLPQPGGVRVLPGWGQARTAGRRQHPDRVSIRRLDVEHPAARRVVQRRRGGGLRNRSGRHQATGRAGVPGGADRGGPANREDVGKSPPRLRARKSSGTGRTVAVNFTARGTSWRETPAASSTPSFHPACTWL